MIILLAYELFCENQSTDADPGDGIPIKKIFVNNNNIELDSTAIAQYGQTETPDKAKNYMQKTFDMPIDTKNAINLPNKKVSPNSKKPYIKITGYYKIWKKKDDMTGTIVLGNKDGANATLRLPDNQITISSQDTHIKFNKTDYFIGKQTLYDAYVDAKIITNDKLGANLFEEIANKFFEFMLKRDFIPGKTGFALYILPNKDEITYKLQNIEDTGSKFVDSFNSKSSNWPAKTTKGVTFLSYDDPAFTINCKEKQEFYQNIGISSNSLDGILLPASKAMNVAGLVWYFFNIKGKSTTFTKNNSGIYGQLYSIYSKIKTGDQKDVNLKAIALKKTNAKLEVIIDENLTMPKLDAIFKKAPDKPVPFAYESLIIKKNRTRIDYHYITAIKSLLNQTSLSWDYIIRIFTQQLRNDITGWLKEKYPAKKAVNFFAQSEFCCKTLNLTHDDNGLVEYENFAKSVGHMARLYLDYRMKIKADNNSVRNILTKQKYDLEALKFVVESIGRGIYLATTSKQEYENAYKEISTVLQDLPKDADQEQDMSFYFYMGYFRSSCK